MSKIAFMFPGQGAQTAGMGKDFYEHSEIARNIIDRSSGLLKLDMKSLCFEENENLQSDGIYPRQHLLRSVWQWSRCCVHPV